MAVEQSVAQMALTRDVGPGGFMERVTAILALTGGSVLSESGQTAYHQSRAFYAQKVVANPALAAQQGAPQIVMGVNISSATTYDEEAKTSTCTATDLAIQSQIMTFWNSLAGIDTPS
jgi:hypothetical protein